MYLMDIGREIIIFILLIYLLYKTKYTYLRIFYSIVLLIHIYKLIINFDEYYNLTKKHILIFLFMFIILLYCLKLLVYHKNINTFIIFFVLFRIITSQLSGYKQIEPIHNNLYIIYSLILIFLYKKYNSYEYKNLFIMNIINHMLLYINI